MVKVSKNINNKDKKSDFEITKKKNDGSVKMTVIV